MYFNVNFKPFSSLINSAFVGERKIYMTPRVVNMDIITTDTNQNTLSRAVPDLTVKRKWSENRQIRHYHDST